MATTAGLVRSFYGWLARKERALREAGKEVYTSLMPAQRPTSIPAVIRVALHSVRVLKGTEFEERAVYWANLFEKIRIQGWQGDVRSSDVGRKKIRKELEEALRGHLAL
jgi:hypothetical protein